MRLRNIRGADEKLLESPFVINEPEGKKGRWQETFLQPAPVYIEIGMGKGKFITTLARENPHINYIGIELYSSVLVRALAKQEEEKLPNLLFICIDALRLTEVFEHEEVAGIYLNFSDPWPKERHAKRRLTSARFLRVYDAILKKDGQVEFKTDNRALFDFSLESIPDSGWKIEAFTYDLHHSDMLAGNVMTEYETKFSAEGKPICKLIASR